MEYENIFGSPGPIQKALAHARMYDSISLTSLKKDRAEVKKNKLVIKVLLILFGCFSLLCLIIDWKASLYFGIPVMLAIIGVLYYKIVYIPSQRIPKSLQGMPYLIGRIYDPETDLTVTLPDFPRLRYFVKKDNSIVSDRPARVCNVAEDLSIDVRQIDFITVPLYENFGKSNATINLIVFVLSKKDRDGYCIEVITARKFDYIPKLRTSGPPDYEDTGIIEAVKIDMGDTWKFDVHYPESFNRENQLVTIEEIKRKLNTPSLLSRTAHRGRVNMS